MLDSLEDVIALAWMAVACALLWGYTKSWNDLTVQASYAFCMVLENQPSLCRIIVPAFAVVVAVLGYKSLGSMLLLGSLFSLCVGMTVTIMCDCIRYPVVHDLGTLVMAFSGLCFILQVSDSTMDIGCAVVSITISYTAHFLRGAEVNPTTNRARHLLWGGIHGATQWLAFGFVYRLTTTAS